MTDQAIDPNSLAAMATPRKTGPFEPSIEQLEQLVADANARIKAEEQERDRIMSLLAAARFKRDTDLIEAKGIRIGDLVTISGNVGGEAVFGWGGLVRTHHGSRVVLHRLKADGTPGKREVPDWQLGSVRPSRIEPHNPAS